MQMHQQSELLQLARGTVSSFLRTGEIPGYETDDPELLAPSGAFVTLWRLGTLRGCMGHLWPDIPLYRVIQEMAVAAATQDPRFPPLKIEELPEVQFEISILSPLQKANSIREIEVGKHGVMIVYGYHRGVLLPEVPVRRGWDRTEFLENLCLKAGLPPQAWQSDSAEFYIFTSEEFKEP